MTKTQKRAVWCTLGALALGGLGYGLCLLLYKLVLGYPETTVVLLFLLIQWFIWSLIWVFSHPVFKLDPAIPKEMSEGHE